MQILKPKSGLGGLLVSPLLGTIAVAIVFSVSVVSPATATARSSRRNAVSATTALRALRGYDRHLLTEVHSARNRVDRYVATTEVQCPGVLGPLDGVVPANANVGAARTMLSQIKASLAMAAQPAFAPAYRQFTRVLSQLGWTSRAPARAVRHLITDLRRVESLRPSNLCAGLSTLVGDLLANGNATTAFVRRYTNRVRALARAERQFVRMLKPDSVLATAVLEGQLASLEHRVARNERSLEHAKLKGLLSRLGLPGISL